MLEAIFTKAISSTRFTVIFGNLGPYPTLVEYFSHNFVIGRGKPDDDLVWLTTHNGLNCYIWIEPPFETQLPCQYKNLVLTSHLDLDWDPSTTDVIYTTLGTIYWWIYVWILPSYHLLSKSRHPSSTHSTTNLTKSFDILSFIWTNSKSTKVICVF
ncbi:hypothetical protein AVEN_68531-1 [Araneus ventricosus]|uniref:Uncharacterized protein n=1 Tax=Araneus ventricosus TaxID=182803 RepID=A0A4Y2HCR9_ARAVE|nr:hypothetical protein AVEN_68531-1 [Araneus ventricosus]